MSKFLQTAFSVLTLVLGLAGGPIGKLIGLGLSLIVGGGLGKKKGDALDNDPRYGFDNLQNPTQAGGPVPVVYGQEQVAPLIAGVNVKQYGDAQALFLLCLVSEGEIEAIENVRLNDVPIESFPYAYYVTRLGTSSQTTIPDFNQLGIPYEAGTKLESGATHIHEMREEADELVLNFVFQGGIYQVNNDGSIGYSNFDVRIEAKHHGAADSTYVVWPHGAVGWELLGNASLRQTGKTQATVRRQIRIALAAVPSVGRGRYTFRVTGQVGDEPKKIRVPVLASIIEVSSDQRTYPDRALLAVAVPASAQLQGGIPRVTCVVKGRKLHDPRTGLTAWSRNPALVVRDMLLNTRYGQGGRISSSDIDDGVGGSFRTVADECDATVTPPGTTTAEALHQCDLVISSKAPLGDWLAKVCEPMRATLFSSGGLIKLSRLKSGSPIRTLSENEGDGVRKGILAAKDGAEERSSLVERTLDEAERWNAVRVGYMDRDQGYLRRTLLIRDQRVLIGGLIQGTSVANGSELSMSAVGGGPTKAFCARTYTDGEDYLYFTQDEAAKRVASSGSFNTVSQQPPATGAWSTAVEYLTPERALEVLLLGVTRKTQALREARHHLNLAALCPRFVTFDVFLGDVDFEPGDHFALTSSRLGYSAKQFTVIAIRVRPDGIGTIEAREYFAQVFTGTPDPVPADPPFTPGGTGGTPGPASPYVETAGKPPAKLPVTSAVGSSPPPPTAPKGATSLKVTSQVKA